jgi:hypothetical protein
MSELAYFHTISSAARFLGCHRNTVTYAVYQSEALKPDAWAGDDDRLIPLFKDDTLRHWKRRVLK